LLNLNKHIKQIRAGGFKVILRKFITLINLALQIPILLLSIPLIIFIRLISSFYLIRFGHLYSGRIGHFGPVTSIYLCEREKQIDQPKKPFLDIFFHDTKPCNSQIAKFWKRNLIIFPYYFRSLIVINELIPGGIVHQVNPKNNFSKYLAKWKGRDIHNLLDETKTYASFTEKEKKICTNQLEKMSITNHSKIILLHVRDDGYLNKNFPDNDWSYKVQNADINDYTSTVKKLASLGYFIIRVGRDSKNFLNLTHKNYIDLDQSGNRTDLLEMYLTSKCHLFIGTNSGMSMIPTHVFRKPTLNLNHVPIGSFLTYTKNILATFKIHFCKNENKKLTISDIFERGLAWSEKREEYESKNVILNNNSSDDIFSAVFEMIDKLDNKWQETPEKKELRDEFLNVYLKNLNKFPKEKKIFHGDIKFNISHQFLLKNIDLIK